MLAWSIDNPITTSHIRPFMLHRDLEALANLIDIAFGEDLALTGSRMAEDMRQMSKLGPALYLAQVVLPAFTGYVWIENEQLIGNVSISQERIPGSWNISNVAVLPEHRGRGIAGQLLAAALGHIQRQGGKRALLQVRSDNALAIELYRRRGFETFDTLYELGLPRHRWPTFLGPSAPQIRRLRYGDGRNLRHLISASTPASTLRQRPIPPTEYHRGFSWLLKQSLQLALGGQETIELVCAQQGTLWGYGKLTARITAPSNLELFVHPSQRGSCERILLGALLEHAQRLPRHDVRAYLSQSHPEALQACNEFQFETLRILDQMAFEITG